MAKFNLTEYKKVGLATQMLQVPVEPSLASEDTTYAASTDSEVFQAETNLIRVMVSAVAYMKIGTAPTATVQSTKLQPDVDYWFELLAGQSYIAAFYDGTT